MELLNQLDGFEDLGQVKMVMATNRPGEHVQSYLTNIDRWIMSFWVQAYQIECVPM